MRSNLFFLAPMALLLAAWVGCGGGDNLSTGKVSGKVTLDGKPVPGGTIILTPAATGRSAGGAVGRDGSFVLSTYGTGDGATVGKHKVDYMAPDSAFPPGKTAETLQPGDEMIPSEYQGYIASPDSIEVKSGRNDLNITLTKPAAP